jgi:hypothetical protein
MARPGTGAQPRTRHQVRRPGSLVTHWRTEGRWPNVWGQVWRLRRGPLVHGAGWGRTMDAETQRPRRCRRASRARGQPTGLLVISEAMSTRCRLRNDILQPVSAGIASFFTTSR